MATGDVFRGNTENQGWKVRGSKLRIESQNNFSFREFLLRFSHHLGHGKCGWWMNWTGAPYFLSIEEPGVSYNLRSFGSLLDMRGFVCFSWRNWRELHMLCVEEEQN